jgi:hypothetical protein
MVHFSRGMPGCTRKAVHGNQRPADAPSTAYQANNAACPMTWLKQKKSFVKFVCP